MKTRPPPKKTQKKVSPVPFLSVTTVLEHVVDDAASPMYEFSLSALEKLVKAGRTDDLLFFVTVSAAAEVSSGALGGGSTLGDTQLRLLTSARFSSADLRCGPKLAYASIASTVMLGDPCVEALTQPDAPHVQSFDIFFFDHYFFVD